MTKKKDPSEWKQKPPKDLVGGDTKTCPCGATIHRDGMANFQWIRKTFCSKTCSFNALAEASWKRRRVVDA